MAYRRRWKPSKSQAKEFAEKIKEIEEFCINNGISMSSNRDSYYFTLNGKSYRVSNHSVEVSNKGAYREDVYGNTIKVRDEYHEGGILDDVVYIHASKTRIMNIYNDLKNGYELDGRGKRKGNK